MDEIVYNSLFNYFNVLEKLGYMSYENCRKLLVLIFYNDFIFKDYRGILSKCDYSCIEKALDCIIGKSCLIPYPNYVKMGKLHISEISELAQRIKTLEETEVVKLLHATAMDNDSEISVVTEE